MIQAMPNLQAHVPATIARKVIRIAKQNHRSVSAEIRVALDRHIAIHESHPEGEPK